VLVLETREILALDIEKNAAFAAAHRQLRF